MKAVLYCRVSSREQEKTGYSLPAQKKLLEEYAEKRGFKVAKVFSVSESASGSKRRKIFEEMMGYTKKHNIKIIAVEKIDRLTRNLKDAARANDWLNESSERELHFVKENTVITESSKSHEKFIWSIKASVAQFYTDNLSEEVKKGQAEKISQGWLPTKPPLGYKTIGEKGHKIHIIDEEVAPLLGKMFKLYSTGQYSLSKLREVVYEEGLRTRGGNKLAKSRLATLLGDPFYYGKIRWNDKIYAGKQEPIINRELFDKVQNTLRSKSTPKYRKHFYLFKGLIRCAECKGTITWEKQKGIIYGHCNGYKDCSQKTWVKEDEVEKQFAEVFKYFELQNPRLAEWVRKALKEIHKDKIEYHESTLQGLEKERQRAQQRLDKLYDDKLDEKITTDFYERKRQEYEEERDAVVAAIERHNKASDEYSELGLNIYELSQKSIEIYQNTSVEVKRKLIGLVFNKLYLDRGVLSVEYSEPFKILFNAVQATNCSKDAEYIELGRRIFERAVNGSNKGKIRHFDDGFRPVLARWDDFITTDWLKILKYPDYTISQTEELLAAV